MSISALKIQLTTVVYNIIVSMIINRNSGGNLNEFTAIHKMKKPS